MQLFQISPTALFGLRHQEATMQRTPEQGLPVLYLRQSGNLKIKNEKCCPLLKRSYRVAWETP